MFYYFTNKIYSMIRKTEKPVKKISTGYLTYVNRPNWSFFRLDLL